MPSSTRSSSMMVLATVAALGATMVHAAAAPTTNMRGAGACVQSYDPTVDYFPEKAVINDTTSVITIKYSNNYKVITNSLTNQTVVLYQCGTPAPTDPAVIKGATQVLPVPVANVSISDTTEVTFLELLGQRQSIKYTTGNAKYIVSPCVQKQLGTAQGIQDANSTAQLQTTSVTFTDPLNGDFSINATNAVEVRISSDDKVLHHVDWINFFAAFFNEEAKGNSLSASITSNYQCLATAATAAAKSNPVQVAIVSYTGPSDFNNQTASWKLKQIANSVQNAGAVLVADPAAGTYVSNSSTPQGTSFTFSSSTALLNAIKDADVVFDDSFADVNGTDVYKSFNLSDASAYKFVKNKKIYMSNRGVTAEGAQATYEQAVVEENIVLADLIAILQPSVLPASSYTPTFYRNVFSEPQVTIAADQCPDPSAAPQLPLAPCSGATATAAPSGAVVSTNSPTPSTKGNSAVGKTASGYVVAAGVLAGLIAAL